MRSTIENPRYEHDCRECTFLGQFEDYDLYFCLQGGIAETVIARWSSNGSDYLSGVPSIGANSALSEAAKRAKEVPSATV